MPPAAATASREGGWTAAGVAAVLALTAWRVALLPHVAFDLFVDDAQYWLWGRELAWGYYSKPPLIGWILRLSTEIGGDDPFWIRLPLPLIHAATALVVMLIGRRLFDARIGALAGLAWVGLPGVAVASLLVSTDTPMLLCFAVALLAFVRLGQGRSLGWALILGAAIGFGLLAKYAMIYFVVSALVTAAVLPGARVALRDTAAAAGLALVIVAPNLVWNVTNQFATLQHTADNTRLASTAAVHPLGLLEFWGGQFAVAGPVVFAAYLAGLAGVRRDPRAAFLALMSLPTFAIVSVQALLAGANSNWAAAGHVAALLLAVAVLSARPRLLALGLGLNLAIAVAAPLLATRADSLAIGDRLVMARYIGREAVSLRAAEIARSEGLDTIVSDSRDILADLFYTLRDAGVALYAAPVQGFPPNHYAQRYPLPPGEGEVLFVTRHGEPACQGGVAPRLVERWRLEQGYTRSDLLAFRVPRSCWSG